MLLLTSAAYISQDFISEIGTLPPSFLPLGNKRLFSHQLAMLRALREPVYLSVPESYQVPDYDLLQLQELGITLLPVKEGLSLGESIRYCYNTADKTSPSLTILHGDTLFFELAPETIPEVDLLTVHRNKGYYQRTAVTLDKQATPRVGHLTEKLADEDEWVLSGFFRISKPEYLMELLREHHGSFTCALNTYCQHKNVLAWQKGTWLDFGHLNSFFHSRSMITTERAFNQIDIEQRVVSKRSDQSPKIQGELNWFKTLPTPLRKYTPQVIGEVTEGNCGYQLEYLHLIPLNDLYVYGNLPVSSWKCIFNTCKKLREDMASYHLDAQQPDLHSALEIYLAKTHQRLSQFFASLDFPHSHPLQLNEKQQQQLMHMATEVNHIIQRQPPRTLEVIHGDLCFSNVLYDPREQSVKLIDPRGLEHSGKQTIYGDPRYDLAKLYQSVVGYYDFIIAGRYQLTQSDSGCKFHIHFPDHPKNTPIIHLFEEVFFNDQPQEQQVILSIAIQLFLSMLPLHNDCPNKQLAMLANAYRLYHKLNNQNLA